MNLPDIYPFAKNKISFERIMLISAASVLSAFFCVASPTENNLALPSYSDIVARSEENIKILNQIILRRGAEEAQARFLRGYYFLGMGDYAKALEDFSHPAVLNSPLAPIAQIIHSQWLIFTGECEKARTILEPLKNNGAYKKFVISLIFDSALCSGDLDAAHSALRTMAHEKPRHIARLAEKYEDVGCKDEADALIRELLASYPLSAEAKRYEERIDDHKFEKTLSDMFWRERAKAFFARGAHKETNSALSNIKNFSYDDRELEGTALYRRKLYSRAIRVLDEIQTPKARYITSACYEKLHNPLQAKSSREEAFNSAIRDEWWAKAGFEIARASDANDDSVKALSILEHIGDNAERTDDKVRALWEVALRSMRAGNFAKANLLLLRYLQLPSIHIEERLRGEFWLARTQERAGARNDAALIFSRLSVEFPDHYYGQRSALKLASMNPLNRDANSYKARQLEFLPINKKAPVVALLIQMGLPGEARLILDELVGFAPSDYDYPLLLARLHLSEGNFRSALRILNSAVQNTALTWRMVYDVIPAEILKNLYPVEFGDIILKYAKKEKLDPLLVCAIIYQESLFDPNALSRAGARGLMQVIPPTGRSIAKEKKERFTVAGLYDPRRSVDYGTYYFAKLLKRFEGRVELALAGYNGGPNRVPRWWNEAQDDTELFVDGITLSETRQYVKKVLTHYERYKRLHREKFN